MIQLYTERLLIRDHVMEDLLSHHALFSDAIVMRYLPDIQTKSLEESTANLKHAIEESLSEQRQCYFFRIEHKTNKEHIGEIGYTVTHQTSLGTLVHAGYFIKEKYWGYGYTTEAFQRIIQYAFEENEVYCISTGCIKENKASEKVMQKCGMIKEQEYKKYVFHEGILKDRVTYRLIRCEWKK